MPARPKPFDPLGAMGGGGAGKAAAKEGGKAAAKDGVQDKEKGQDDQGVQLPQKLTAFVRSQPLDTLPNGANENRTRTEHEIQTVKLIVIVHFKYFTFRCFIFV